MTSTQPVEVDPVSWDDLGTLRVDVATLLGLTDADELGPDDDLLSVGLESLTLIQLVTRWRAAGIDVDFAELAEAPTLREWARILRRAPRGDRAEPAEAGPALTPWAGQDPRADSARLDSEGTDPAGTDPAGVDPAGAGSPDHGGSWAVGEPFPLATMQHAYWVGRQPGQPFGGVAAHFYVEFDGAGIDPERLRRAFTALVARHGMLRSRVTEDGRAVIGEVTEPRLPVRDLRRLPPAEVEARLSALRSDYTHRMMDVEAGEICEVALTLLPEGATRLHLDLDMVASDALSLRILFEDLRRLYLAAAPAAAAPADGRVLPPLTYTFPRYLADRAARGDERVSRARQWWQDRLDDLPGAPDLPLRPGAGEPGTTARSTRLDHWIDPGRRAVLTERARHRGVTPAAALATAFAEVIGAWSASPRFLLNLPLFDRDPLYPDVDLLVGDFSSSLLLEVDLGEPMPFAVRARAVQQTLAGAIAHGSYSGVDILRDLSRRRGHPVLAPVVYTSALGLGDIYSSAVQECFGRPAWTISQGPQVWLDAQVTEHDGGLLLNWDVRLDCLDEGIAQDAFAAYRALVDRLAGSDDPWQAPVGSLLPAAQASVRAEVNATRRAHPARTLHEVVFRRAADEAAEETADGTRHPAVIAGDRRLTYGGLADAALRVAALLADEGVRPGDTVVVTLPRGVDQVVAVLGVLAAGAAYLPLGVDQPPLRRVAVHARSGARLVLTDTATSPLLAAEAAGAMGQALRSVDIAAAAAREPLLGPVEIDPHQAAYVLFTSGSTGEPKGVEVTHAAAANTIDALNHRFEVGPRDRTLALSALDFDLSVYDLFGALAAGGAVVLLADEDRRDAAAWWRALTDNDVTVWNTVPALLDMLLTAAPPAAVPPAARGLRLVLLGGDVVGVDLPARTRAIFPAARFVALGGMTEAAIHSTAFEVSPEQADEARAWPSMPWGMPLAGVRARVVDAQGRDCPDRVTGELWIGGRSVARGYRGDPARTADRFVEHAGTRWYRTGDLARYRSDGVLEFLGRADGQVKIRGHRIELGEVEAAARSHPGVAAAAATVVAGAARRLALVVQPAEDPGEDRADSLMTDSFVESLREWLTERLPEAARPQLVVVRPRIPLSRNGKVDRVALAAALTAEPATGGDGVVFTPPWGAVESAVAGIWSDLLGAERVGRDDTFVSLGGDSLLATTMLVRLREAGLTGGRLGRLFTTPRLADFAATLETDGAMPPLPGEDDGLAADQERRHEPFPPTDVQRAYWIGRDERLPLGGVGTWHYTEFDVPAATWDQAALETALRGLVERHEMLRAVFDEDGNQRILADVPPPRVDVRAAAPRTDPDAELAAFRREHSHRVLDLTRWPLFEVSALRYERAGQGRVRLAVGLDYLVFDALSIMTLYTELGRLYVAARAGARPPALQEIGVSFRDYVLGVRPDPRAAAADQEYWRARLAELPPAPALPTALDPAQISRPRFERHRHWHEPRVWERLRAAARRHDVTVSTVLLAAYGEVLAAWSAHTDLTITLTLFDRRPVHPDIARLLGDFTTLSLADHRRADTWLATVGGLQRRLAADLDHREVSPIWLLRELARATGALEAMPVVFTSAIGVGDGVSMDLSDAFGEPVYGLSQSPQVGLDNQVVEADGGLQVSWDVVEGLFRPGVVDAMFASYNRLIGWLADGDWSGQPPDLLPPGQREARAARNATAVDRAPATLHGAFFGRAVTEPGRTALVWEHPQAGPATMSYRDLADAALRVAGSLVTRGVVPGDTVAITLPKGLDQIVAVLGVLAAGAAYVPIGVEQPALRRARIHATSGARYVITDDAAEPTGEAGPEVLGIGRALAGPALATPVPVDPDSLAYVIFTSGSTGEPKGVEIAHDAAANTVADINARFGVGAGDRVLALSALDFDLSAYDVFGLLGAGGALVLAAEDDRRDAQRWLSLARDHGVTVWNTVPALLDMLLVAAEAEPLPAGLRLALVSGDWVGLDLPGRLRERTGGRCRLVALGGATEASIWSNAFEVDEVPEDWSSVPYGFPLSNQAYRVVDPWGDDRPDWVPGELWIGGRGVALGYRGDPRRTADRFVRRAGDRWYRTGDLGRYWPDGTLEFLGRSDQQVKVGGHRIELNEVEAALEGFPPARAAAVVAVGDRHHRALHAFVVPAAPAGDDAVADLVAALRAHLADRLPPYAVPARVSVLAELPLTANGKIDRLALAALGEDLTTLDGVAPDPGAQAAIAALWSELLGVRVADRDANFFGAGGDSMLALRMVGALRARFGVDVPVRGFLAAPTVAGLAALVLEHGDAAVFEPEAFEEGVL